MIPTGPNSDGNSETTNETPNGPDKATSDMQLGEGGQGPNLAIGENLHEDRSFNREMSEKTSGTVSGMLGVGRFPQTHLLGIFFWGWFWKDENILQDRSGLVLDLEFVGFLVVFFCLGRRLRNVKYLHDRMFDTDKCCFILGKMNEIWNIFEWHMSYVSW